MSNLEILKEVKKIYNPQTAFGNEEIIKLFSQVMLPNDAGMFEIEGTAEEVHVIKITWNCTDCGRYHEEDSDDINDYLILRKCESCGAPHKISL